MKRMLKWLAGLYPEAWRARYGAEYEALPEEREARVRDVVDVAWTAAKMWAADWRLVRLVLPCVVVGGLAALLMARMRPAVYTSGTVVVSQVKNLNDGSATSSWPPILDLARNAFADQEAMERIIRKYNLYPRERAKVPLDRVVDKTRSAIRVRPASNSNMEEAMRENESRTVYDSESMERMNRFRNLIRAAFTIQFEYPDPRIAQRVDAELLSLITGANLRREEAEYAAADRSRIPGMVSVLDAPNLPDKPDEPNWAKWGAVGLFWGLVFGMMVVALGRLGHVGEKRRS